MVLTQPTCSMAEQPRVITRERLHNVVGTDDAATMREVDNWLRDFPALP